MKLTHEEVTQLVTMIGELDIKMAELLGVAKGKEQMEMIKATWDMVTDIRWLIFNNIVSGGKS